MTLQVSLYFDDQDLCLALTDMVSLEDIKTRLLPSGTFPLSHTPHACLVWQPTTELLIPLCSPHLHPVMEDQQERTSFRMLPFHTEST